MKPSGKSVRGFTLVEIMTVVVIVGVLSSLAVPSLMRLKKKSEETMILNSLRQLYDAKEYYFTENGGAAHVSLDKLVKEGYASNSIKAAFAHPVGDWVSATWALKPGQPVTATERIRQGNRVTYGRKLAYPPE
jgi:prepilin-type N-terminal cleavage/methylation domain-containing protein